MYNYRRARFVYETPILRYERDALVKATKEAVARSSRYSVPDAALGHAFRVVDVTYSVTVDADRDEYDTDTRLELIAFPITKRTERGFRIRLGGGDDAPVTTWVAFRHRKQWASLTPEAAMESYIARREKQARIYEGKANRARYLAADARHVLDRHQATGGTFDEQPY